MPSSSIRQATTELLPASPKSASISPHPDSFKNSKLLDLSPESFLKSVLRMVASDVLMFTASKLCIPQLFKLLLKWKLLLLRPSQLVARRKKLLKTNEILCDCISFIIWIIYQYLRLELLLGFIIIGFLAFCGKCPAIRGGYTLLMIIFSCSCLNLHLRMLHRWIYGWNASLMVRLSFSKLPLGRNQG